MKRKKVALILAGGKGKRMEMDLPKCLVKIKNKTMIEMVIDNVKDCVDEIIVVLGYKAIEVRNAIDKNCRFCYQEKQLGTADAVKSSFDLLKDVPCDILIMAVDMPFVRKESINNAFFKFYLEKADILVSSFFTSEDSSYGKIIRDDNKNIVRIVEKKDCNLEEENIREVNASLYIIKSEEMFSYLEEIKNENAQGEFYFTDIVEIYYKARKKITSYLFEEPFEVMGINSKEDLEKAKRLYK